MIEETLGWKIENLVEEWCEKKGIDFEKIPKNIIDKIIYMIEEDINNFIEDKGIDIAKEWCWMYIEQELGEHPEWKIKQKAGDDLI